MAKKKIWEMSDKEAMEYFASIKKNPRKAKRKKADKPKHERGPKDLEDLFNPNID